MDIQLENIDTLNQDAFVNIFNLYHHNRAKFLPELYPHVDEEGYFDRDVALDLLGMNPEEVQSYLIRFNGKFAGLLVVSFAPFVMSGTDCCIQDIFILNSHRSKGIATSALHLLFDDVKGVFSVNCLEADKSAISFWDNFIQKNCEIISKSQPENDSVVFKFKTL